MDEKQQAELADWQERMLHLAISIASVIGLFAFCYFLAWLES